MALAIAEPRATHQIMELAQQVAAQWDQRLSDGERSTRDVEKLNKGQEQGDLVKHGRTICGVARPHFVSAAALLKQHQVVRVIANALVKARDHVVADREREVAHLGQYYDWIGDLMQLETQGVDHGSIVRLDAFMTASELHFVELNSDCPGGSGTNDRLAEIFRTLETYEEIDREFELRPLQLRPRVGKALVDAWRDWGGKEAPRVALVTWFVRYGFSAESFEHEAQVFLREGVQSIVAVEPNALDYHGRKLRANGDPIDLVYRVLLTRDVLNALDDMKPLLTALRENAVCMVNPFRSELMGHKTLFALLSDPDVPLGLSAEEHAVIRTHVPWGRCMREGWASDPNGERTDLLEYVVNHRDELVLKPTHAAQGEGVELGWHHSASSWEDAIRRALAADYVVQERVPTHRAPYPIATAALPRADFYEDTDPFVTRGHLGGFLTRLSTDEIVNVGRGGSVVPSFVVKRR